MTLRSPVLPAVLTIALSVASTSTSGCSGGTSLPPDAGERPDAASPTDTGADAASTDAAVTIDAAVGQDAAVPADAYVGNDADIALCDYVAVDEVIVLCDATNYTFVNHFTSTVAGCPEFYGFDPNEAHFTDFASAIASAPGCDASCQWHFATSVSRIYCGHRDGYETLSAVGCADVYRFAEGYYASVEAHDTANPCP